MKADRQPALQEVECECLALYLFFPWSFLLRIVHSRQSFPRADRIAPHTDPDPPANLTPRALGLLNPAGTLPALAVTYDSEALDVLLVVSLVEPQWEEAADATGEPAHHWPLEARRLARLKTGHRGRGQEALPRIVLDPERHARGTVYVVRDQSVLRVTLPWVRRIEELGDEAGEEVRGWVTWLMGFS